MSAAQVWSLVSIIVMLLISGLGDSQGFIHAAKMWHNERMVWSELGKSAMGFVVGNGTYLLAVKYLKEFGVLSPETQTLIWFGVTIVGVAAISGRFFRWQTTDQVIAVAVLCGIGLLLFRTGG